MGFNARKSAKKILQTGLNAGREKITTDELIAAHPDCISICGVDIVNINGQSVPVFIFVEDPKKYFFGGKCLREMVEEWLEDTDGDLSIINADLAQAPLQVRLLKIKTQKGYDYTHVEYVGDDA